MIAVDVGERDRTSELDRSAEEIHASFVRCPTLEEGIRAQRDVMGHPVAAEELDVAPERLDAVRPELANRHARSWYRAIGTTRVLMQLIVRMLRSLGCSRAVLRVVPVIDRDDR